MVAKRISAVCAKKIEDWLKTIPEEEEGVRKAIKEGAYVTGGALVSLLENETPNDFDIYFRTEKQVLAVAAYYVQRFKEEQKGSVEPEVQRVRHLNGDATNNRALDHWVPVKDNEPCDRVRVFIRSSGVAGDLPEEFESEVLKGADVVQAEEGEGQELVAATNRYAPVFMSSNAITLRNKVQLVLRFYGEPEEVHKNYDFVHCTCVWQAWDHKVLLPAAALEAIINHELRYVGSKYPLCSIIRTRKFLKRGWNINAGQYLKMCLQLGELDLTSLATFEEQLTGVDSAYFNQAISYMKQQMVENPNFNITVPYLIEVINRIF